MAQGQGLWHSNLGFLGSRPGKLWPSPGIEHIFVCSDGVLQRWCGGWNSLFKVVFPNATLRKSLTHEKKLQENSLSCCLGVTDSFFFFWQPSLPSSCLSPDRPFHIFRASRSGIGEFFCSSKTSIGGFCCSKIVKGSVGPLWPVYNISFDWLMFR